MLTWASNWASAARVGACLILFRSESKGIEVVVTTERLCKLINQIIEPAVTDISRQTRFVEDLGMRSLGLITLVVCCERELGIDLMSKLIPTQHFADVGTLMEFITQRMIHCSDAGELR
jgi:acyl carrier protein